MTARKMIWARDLVTEMLLILKNYFRTDYSRASVKYDRPKKCPTILYGANLWLSHWD